MRYDKPFSSLAGAGALAAGLLSGPGTASAAEALKIDRAHSNVGFRVRHINTMVSGRFKEFEGTLDPARPPAWSKVPFVRRLLDQYDWVFWLDADALIMNPDVALEGLLDPGYSLILVKQPGPDPFGNLHLNTGSFFIKSDRWAKAFLDDLYRQTGFIDHPCWEQEAFMHLYRQRPDARERIKVEVDARAFNSIANSYVKGDFVFHAINPMLTEAGKIQLIERVRADDARIPERVEPGMAVGLMYHDEEERDLLEFTVPGLLSVGGK